jgi:hypothetical protein
MRGVFSLNERHRSSDAGYISALPIYLSPLGAMPDPFSLGKES